MKSFLHPNNPLFEEHQLILVNLKKLVPHNGYLDEYITCNLFPWKEDFLNQHLNVYKENLLLDDDVNSRRIINLNIEWIEKSLEEIEPRTVKISRLNRQVPNCYFKLTEANFDIETNTLLLSAEEEMMLNSGYFRDEINKRFETLKIKIEDFYNTNNRQFKSVLQECFKNLSDFSVDKKYLEIAYDNEPRLEYDKLDIILFKDLINNQWKKLMEFVNEKKILLNYLNNDFTNTKSDTNNYPPIFKDENSFQKFITIAELLGVDFEDIGKHGNKAKLWAMWDNEKTKEGLMKSYKSKEDYALSINKEFNSSLNSKSTSDTYTQSANLNSILNSGDNLI